MSLVTTPRSSLATCCACGGSRVTALAMTLTDGTAVDFVSCHSCEHKTWSKDGVELAVDEVLLRARKPR